MYFVSDRFCCSSWVDESVSTRVSCRTGKGKSSPNNLDFRLILYHLSLICQPKSSHVCRIITNEKWAYTMSFYVGHGEIQIYIWALTKENKPSDGLNICKIHFRNPPRLSNICKQCTHRSDYTKSLLFTIQPIEH